jgi:carboxymethylenebutenolidase
MRRNCQAPQKTRRHHLRVRRNRHANWLGGFSFQPWMHRPVSPSTQSPGQSPRQCRQCRAAGMHFLRWVRKDILLGTVPAYCGHVTTIVPPGPAKETEMARIDVQIPTEDGVARGSLHVPDGDGPWPGVVMFPDALGLRDAMKDMGDRLASLGYVVLVPDVFYRAGDWAPFDPRTAFSDEQERNRIFGLIGSLSNERVVADAAAYANFLLARPEVRGTAIGTTGYCMGGRMSLVAAGGIGDKIAAAASFHAAMVAIPGNPDSPHLAADNIRARVYVAGSIEDAGFTTEHAELLTDALTRAGVEHTVEFYPGYHGFAVPDMPVHDQALAERHWEALRTLYAAALP